MRATAALLTAALSLLVASTAASRTWYIKADGSGDLPTIQAAIDAAEPGDEILVAPGRYTWANQGGSPPHAMIHIARYREGFTLRSEAGPDVTIIDAQRQNRVMLIDGMNGIVIEGFTITGGDAPSFGSFRGGGIAMAHTEDVIRNCIFENNFAGEGGGIFNGGHGTILIEGCIFRNNVSSGEGGGLWFGWSPLGFDIVDCQIYNNTAHSGGGIYATRAAIAIENTAIINNTAEDGGGFFGRDLFPTSLTACSIISNDAQSGGGLRFDSGSPVGIERCLIASNGIGAAIELQLGAAPTIACCDLYGNSGGNTLPPAAVDNGGNFSADPNLCNPPWWPDPTLHDNSPCLPGNHPGGAACGVIGAREMPCLTVPVEQRTLGGIKSLFRKR